MSCTVLFFLFKAEALQAKDRASAATPTDKPSEGDIREFRRQCVLVLNSVDGLCLLAQFPEHYIKVFGRKFQPSDFKAKKLLQLLELIAENVEVSGCGGIILLLVL